MQIVIEIPEMAYNLLKSDETIDWLDAETILDRIVEGTVLPKGYGRLIDADALDDSLGASDRDIYCKAIIEDAPTILEADR